MWPAIIAGGASILSSVLPSILGGKQKSPGQVPYEHIRNSAVRNALALVEAGKQSGIHPLALLGSGVGGGGFAQPVGGSQFGLGDAVGAGLGALSDVLYQQDADVREADAERRAVAARQREAALENLRAKELTPERKLALRNAELQNELLELDLAQSRTKLASIKNATVGAAPVTTRFDLGNGEYWEMPAGRADQEDLERKIGESADLVGAGWSIEDLLAGRIHLKPNYLGRLEKRWNDYLRSFKYKAPRTDPRRPGTY